MDPWHFYSNHHQPQQYAYAQQFARAQHPPFAPSWIPPPLGVPSHPTFLPQQHAHPQYAWAPQQTPVPWHEQQQFPSHHAPPNAHDRGGRGRGRGGRSRGDKLHVATLTAQFADPHSTTKYDVCDPEAVEGLWGRPKPAPGPLREGGEVAGRSEQQEELQPQLQQQCNGGDAGPESSRQGLKRGRAEEQQQQEQQGGEDHHHHQQQQQQEQHNQQQQQSGEEHEKQQQQQQQQQCEKEHEQQQEQQQQQQQCWKEREQQQQELHQQQQCWKEREQQQGQCSIDQQQKEEEQPQISEEDAEASRERRRLPILLFDLNGTLTSHTSQRKAAGTNVLRPRAALLARLAKRFRLGIYTSSTVRTVAAAKDMLEREAGCPLFEPRLVLYRLHTQPAPPAHCQSSGKDWDTVKPLKKWFERLDRVLLFDDDSYKAVPGEEGNMVVVPAWGSSGQDEDPGCRVLEALVEAIEQELGGLDADADVRTAVGPITQRLTAAAQARNEELQNLRSIPPEVPPDENEIELEL